MLSTLANKFIDVVKHMRKKDVPDFLMQKGHLRSFSYRIANALAENRMIGDDDVKSKLDRYQRQQLSKKFNNSKNCSARREAKKLGVSAKTVLRHRRSIGISNRKRQKAPKYKPKQVKEVLQLRRNGIA